MHTRLKTEQVIAQASSLCLERRQRFTPLRSAVLTLIWDQQGAIKAYDILDKLKSKIGAAKPPTVYRALDFLLENGLVHKLNSINAYIACAHPKAQHRCFFLICSGCGLVQEMCHNSLNAVLEQKIAQHDFHPSSVTLEVQGRCRTCAQQEA